MDIVTVVVDSSSFAICAACVLLLGFAPLAAVGPGVVFGRCSRRSECSSAAARVPVSGRVSIDEFATATIVAASSISTPFILSVRSCIFPQVQTADDESITKKSFQNNKSERRNINPSQMLQTTMPFPKILSQRLSSNTTLFSYP